MTRLLICALTGWAIVVIARQTHTIYQSLAHALGGVL
jgi:hypothetical protein